MESSKDKQLENELDASFWNDRWHNGQTGWDVGYASPPITTYLEQYKNKNAAIVIPGCGNAYEAAFMLDHGFTNITLVDIAAEAVSRLKKKFKSRPGIKIYCEDFFQHKGQYDLVIEQTFFCAQILQRRTEYVEKVFSLLKEKGRLAGVLFGIDFPMDGPPFGGKEETYKTLFEPYFQMEKMESCYNSIPPRAGSELFINLVKKED